MRRTIDPMVHMQRGEASRPSLLRPSVSMSLRLVIPWRVALQQSSPPLHQPATILNQEQWFEKEIYSMASVPIENCLNRGVHPILLCPICVQNKQHSTET